MNKNLVLIDALNLIRRIFAVDMQHSHHSDQQMIASCKARVKHATQKIIQLTKPTHMIAVFDGDKSWRYHYFEQYKHSRKPMPSLLFDNLTTICEAFSELGVTAYRPEQDEADDIIATLACKAQTGGIPSTIISTDKGFYPFMSDYIGIFDYFKKAWVTDEEVESRFGVAKASLVELWALAGDKTNDIPGVAGVGNKSAVALIKEYGNVDTAMAHEQFKPALRNKIAEGMDNYIISKNLVSLRTDIHLGFNLNQIRLTALDAMV
ncbi:flap endonuclease Xni [Pseudoalteromonas citrea]|uniref:Flap endonuclease Xni n=1 Tax=Pseudoalteromonas citrea TaxID=43655 RepID=A0A5S3XNC2_9GAMM|nr:flap endonuclease Xni [Pseudoalteromonas citrea]TMP42755.1 flap endonuclease Xni [Pseudoalteromonas citrea]TMP56636.1 flap endonuclease Xni [Pseudoalteromonas citrea]